MGDCYHGNSITLIVCVVQKCTLSLSLSLAWAAVTSQRGGDSFME